MVNRRLIRETVMQILYAYEMRKEDIRKVAEGLMPEEITSQPKSKEFAFSLLEQIIANLPLLDSKIASHADNWALDRIAVIDKNLMRIAITEMLCFPDVPPKVSINEAIEIAKHYSTDKSGRFVNGILDAILIEMKANGELQKAGRGLVDMPAKHPKEQPQPTVMEGDPPPLFQTPPPKEPPRRSQSGTGQRGKPPFKPNANRSNPNRQSDNRNQDNRSGNRNFDNRKRRPQ